MRLLSFLKDLVVLLLNCRNNVHIPQFLRRNWHSTGSLVVSRLECDVRMPRLKPRPRYYNFPKFSYFFSCFDTFDFKYTYIFLSIYFSFLTFTKKIIMKENDKYCWVWSTWCEVFGTLLIFEQELNLKRIGISMSNITVITLNNSGNGRGVVAYTYF